jgi:protein-tyrosine phosphatase
MDPFFKYRRNSKGPCSDPPAKVHPKIMFGPGFYLTDSFIEKYNITHVINCADESAVSDSVKHKFLENYVCLDAIDSPNVNITKWYPLFEIKMNKFLRQYNSKMIYVNCQMGINRSGFLATLYACMKLGYPYESVTKAVLLQRPCALMNTVFHEQVQQYIKKHR